MDGETPAERHRRKRCNTVEDAVAADLNILIACPCRRNRVVEAPALLRLCNLRRWPVGFVALWKHLKCVSCGAKLAAISATALPPDADPPIGPGDVISFELLKRRLRG
jgi:hypothetical protein